MASPFVEIVNRRPKDGNKVDIRPLWKLKLTDEEFNELRTFLLTGVKLKHPDWFRQYPRECLLFFAEYWKRWYEGGKHSVRDVIRCLSKDLDQDYEKSFYRAACNGASMLKIEIYEGERRRQLDSILYQGGLPMRLICQSEREGFENWTAFAKRFVRGYIDLSDDELGLGQVATNLQSIRQFAEQLYLGVATDNPELMPFYCPNREHPWFKALMELKESERRRSQEANPFVIDWMIELDDRKNRGRILGMVQIPSRITQTFLEEHHSGESNYTTARVLTDGIIRASVEYQQGYARMSRDILVPMPISGSVLSIDFEGHIVATGSFDYTRPHLFSLRGRQANGLLRGERTTRIKEEEMALFIPENWELENSEQFSLIDYVFSDIPVSIVYLPSGFSKEIRIKDAYDNIVVFNGNPIGETVVLYTPLYSDMVLSPSLCDASKLQKCHILKETSEGIIRQSQDIEFEDKENHKWTSIPGFGKLKARGSGVDKESSVPVILCNVGEGFRIAIIDADSESASIRIFWPQGQVTCLEKSAVYSPTDNTWTVKKENLLDPMAVRFRLSATAKGSKPFLLRLRAPFRQAEITDESGMPVEGTVFVPLCDYEKFSYSIFGYNSGKIRVGKDVFNLTAYKTRMILSPGNDFTQGTPRKIYRHGSIAALFGSNGQIRQKLENQKGTIITASVDASLRMTESNLHTIRLNIREYPFSINWDPEENIFTLTDPNGRERAFKHSLLAFKLKQPTEAPVTIKSGEDGILRMPEELRFQEDLLIVGNVPGRVRPALFNKSDTEHTPRELFLLIDKNIQESSIGSDTWKDCLNWFEQAAQYGIPYSSLLQLRAISIHSETLIAFVFQCMLQYGGEDKERLMDRLIQFSRDLHFKWFWLIPAFRHRLFKTLEGRIDIKEESFIRSMVPPAIATLPKEYIIELALNAIPTKMSELGQFLEELMKRSLGDTQRYVKKDMQEASLSWITNTGTLANRLIVDEDNRYPDLSPYLGFEVEEFRQHKIKNKTANENWLLSRANAFAKHMEPGTEKVDMFGMSIEARRSMCLCYDIEPNLFIREAHNAMIDLRTSKK